MMRGVPCQTRQIHQPRAPDDTGPVASPPADRAARAAGSLRRLANLKEKPTCRRRGSADDDLTSAP